jgi:hypothetical protein
MILFSLANNELSVFQILIHGAVCLTIQFKGIYRSLTIDFPELDNQSKKVFPNHPPVLEADY